MMIDPRRSLAELPALVLGPLRDRSDGDWERGPAGKWTPAQIVEPLALGLALSAETFQARRNHAPMSRRPRTPAQQVARFFILGLRWFPPCWKAPERPPTSAEIHCATAERYSAPANGVWRRVDRALMPERRANLFVKHPRMGDLTI